MRHSDKHWRQNAPAHACHDACAQAGLQRQLSAQCGGRLAGQAGCVRTDAGVCVGVVPATLLQQLAGTHLGVAVEDVARSEAGVHQLRQL